MLLLILPMKFLHLHAQDQVSQGRWHTVLLVSLLKVKIPKAVSAEAEPGKGVVIEIGEGGNISINGKASSGGALYDAVKSALAKSPPPCGATLH